MSQPRYCAQCGLLVTGNERFCPHCGAQLPEPLPQLSRSQTPSLPPPVAAQRINSSIVRWSLIGLIGLVIAGGVGFWLSNRPLTTVNSPTVTANRSTVTPTGSSSTLQRTTPTTTFLLSATPAGSIISQPTPMGAAALARTAQVQTVQTLRDPVQTAPSQQQTAQAIDAEVSALFAASRRIFYDEFVDNRNAWFTGVFQEIELDVIEDGVFKVFWTGKGTSYELYELGSFTNFISEVDCRIARGDGDGSCSLVFGHRREVGFYKFEFFIDYYRLFTVPVEGDLVTLAEGDPRQLTTLGEFNRLRVIRQGDRIRLFINSTLVAEVRDTTFTSGRIGVSTTCYREDGGVEVHFDNFGIWSLPDGL